MNSRKRDALTRERLRQGDDESMMGAVLRAVDRIEDKVDHLEHEIHNQTRIIMADLTSLQNQVAQNTSVEESAVTLINGLASQLAAAGTDPAKLQALQDSLQASASDLAKAVAANTPAAPAAPAATPPTT